jgi:superfamily II DNA/RNA helicase
MVFCNTLNSSRAVDHFLTENQISTVNYHGEVPAEERFVIFFTLLSFYVCII